MITVNDIKEALTPIAPSAHHYYGGSATTYITFFMYNEQPEEYAENKPIATGTYWQIDLWRTEDDDSDSNLFSLKEQMKESLASLGFQGFTAQDLYESDTKTDHIALRCNYVE